MKSLMSHLPRLRRQCQASSAGRTSFGKRRKRFRLRQTDFRGDGQRAGIPWLGMPVAELETLKSVLVVGSFLAKDHPLVAHRLRQAAKKGAAIARLHSVADDSKVPVAHSIVVAPSLLPAALAQIVVAAAHGAGKQVPAALAAARKWVEEHA